MAILQVTSHLNKVGPRQPCSVAGKNLRESLEELFRQYPLLCGYILDDRGAIRKHVAIFIDGERATDLNHPLAPDAKVHLLQALSGG